MSLLSIAVLCIKGLEPCDICAYVTLHYGLHPNECYPCWSRSALLPRIHLSECHRLLQNNLCHCSNPHPCFLQCSRFTGLAPVRAASHPFVLIPAPVKIHILPLSPRVNSHQFYHTLRLSRFPSFFSFTLICGQNLIC